jgi:hypothetical protein
MACTETEKNRMTTRADKIIEGFKLGSLGAGRKPMRGADEQPVHSKVMEKGVNQIRGLDCPYVYWVDTDKWAYCLNVSHDFNEPDLWVLVFAGGPKMKLGKLNEIVGPDDADFAVESAHPDKFKKMLKWYNRLLSLIETDGLNGILGYVLNFYSNNDMWKFEKWKDRQLKAHGGKI